MVNSSLVNILNFSTMSSQYIHLSKPISPLPSLGQAGMCSWRLNNQFHDRWGLSPINSSDWWWRKKKSWTLGSPVRRKLHSREPKRCLPRVHSMCTNCPLWRKAGLICCILLVCKFKSGNTNIFYRIESFYTGFVLLSFDIRYSFLSKLHRQWASTLTLLILTLSNVYEQIPTPIPITCHSSLK